ncbi:hypothetical protein [Streptomyces alkaliterrae]|uniref:Uncharacterized protein n=1 Tax=Streptomyces alkaliterrae TaxID=2213162 RepID=A0A5P0YRS6_9ACTN|nr:hypothetical protein [Streptomyces alkaliterrae]MBB1255060.1 hypothetical protein [Streptomyces alkaliterrae]MBB1262106.1 hypothetical protein [Streptomyces alkaliterrae]MQS03031.1 hypothetical protein [Streptomyces alkaliterrae]
MTTSVTFAHAADLVLLADTFDKNKVTPGVLGFLVFAVMGLAVWWLMRSMTRRMEAVRGREFPVSEPGAATGGGREDS